MGCPAGVNTLHLLQKRPDRFVVNSDVVFNGYLRLVFRFKWLERDADYSHPYSAEVRMNGAIPRLRPYAFMLAQRQSFFSGFYDRSLNECGFICNQLRVSVIEVGSLNPSRVTGISLRSPRPG